MKAKASLTLLFGFYSVIALLTPTPSLGLEIEPGLYRNAPRGLNGIIVGYGYTAGDLDMDNTRLTVENAKSHIHASAIGYARYGSFFGKSVRADVVVPMAWAHFEGNVNGQFLTRDPHGFTDPRFRLILNLVGAPSLNRAEYARYQQNTIWAVSFQFSPPLGQYDPGRLINLGANRYSFQSETGLSKVWGNWCTEAAVGAWAFTTNHDYYGGRNLDQAPIYFAKGDVIYSFNKKAWLTFYGGVATGGRTSINDVEQNTEQTNQLFGGTFSVPIQRHDIVSIGYSRGLAAQVGSDFNAIAIKFAHTWGGR